MSEKLPHILLLEPYCGGSHRAFLNGLRKHLQFKFTLLSLPARKWKMRMQLAAPWMADRIISYIGKGENFDAILCSTFVDVATLQALLAQKGIHIPTAIYFHENQFAYPNQINDLSQYQFAALNFTSALAADSLAFNSTYNLDTFLDGVAGYLDKATDMDIIHKVEEIRKKSVVLYPGIDFSGFDVCKRVHDDGITVIVWNHRWEHDKDPETFFKTLIEFSREEMVFKLIVLGQHFERSPEIFAKAQAVLEPHIIHFGYAKDRLEYFRLLCQADIVVSTALHEFFGMAVLEAVHCGCRPLVPDRLSYRELFPEQYRYPEGGFSVALAELLEHNCRPDMVETLKLTNRFSWQNMAVRYQQWLLDLL